MAKSNIPLIVLIRIIIIIFSCSASVLTTLFHYFTKKCKWDVLYVLIHPLYISFYNHLFIYLFIYLLLFFYERIMFSFFPTLFITTFFCHEPKIGCIHGTGESQLGKMFYFSFWLSIYCTCDLKISEYSVIHTSTTDSQNFEFPSLLQMFL